MGNKLVLVIVALVVVIGGGIFLIHNGGFGNSKTLTRDEAAKMIADKLKSSPVTVGVLSFPIGVNDSQEYEVDFSDASLFNNIDALQKAGLIANVKNAAPNDNRAKVFTLTDQAKPYLQPAQDFRGKQIILGNIAKVEVTGLTAPSTNNGQQSVIANYTAYYDLTPFGEILAPKDATEGIQSRDGIVLYDDGWRANDPLF